MPDQPSSGTIGGVNFTLEVPASQLQLFDKIKPYILSQRLFLDQGCELPASKFELVEAQDTYQTNLLSRNTRLSKLYYLYVMTETEPAANSANWNLASNYLIKVYSISLSYDSSHSIGNNFTIGGIKKVRYIEGCANMWSHNFLDFGASVAEFYQAPEEMLNLEQAIMSSIRDHEKQKGNLAAPANNYGASISDSKKQEYMHYLNFRANRYVMLETKFPDSVVVLDADGKRFKLFLGKECVYEFGFNHELLSTKLMPEETIHKVEITKPGLLRLELKNSTKTGHQATPSRIVHLANAVPHINHTLLTTLLKVWLAVYQPMMYYELVKDLLLNCYDLHHMSTSPLSLGSEEALSSNFKTRSHNLQVRVCTYFGYLLTAQEKNPWTTEQLASILSPHSKGTETKRLGGVSDEEGDPYNSVSSSQKDWNQLSSLAKVDQDLFDLADVFGSLQRLAKKDHQSNRSTEEQTHSNSNGSQVRLNSAKQEEICLELPRVSMSIESFNRGKIRLFKFLHLLYEDLKLNSMRKSSKDDLGFFLYVYASQLMLPQSLNYCDYYSRDNPDYPYMYSSNQSLQMVDSIGRTRSRDKLSSEVGNSLSHTSFAAAQIDPDDRVFCSDWVEEEPFDIHKFLTGLLADKDNFIKRYPILFKKTHFLTRIFMMNLGSTSEKTIKVMSCISTTIASDPKRSGQGGEGQNYTQFQPVHKINFTPNQEMTKLETLVANLKSRMSIMSKSSARSTDSVFLFMVEQKFPQSALDNLGTGVRTIVEHILREVRVSLPSYLFDPSLPKGAYALIGREDIYMNILLYPKVKPLAALLPGSGGRPSGNSYYLHEKNPGNLSVLGGSANGNNPNTSFAGINNTPQQGLSRDQTPLNYTHHYTSYVADRNNSMLSDRTSGQGGATGDGYQSNYSHIKEDRKEARGEDFGNKTLSTYFEGLNNIRLNIQDDLVFNEIQRILNISDLIRIKSKYIDQLPEDPDRQDIENEAHQLRRFLIRRLSVLVGRGAVTVNTDRSLFTEVLHIPKINLTAILESTNRKITLEKKEETFNWPEFHSGVAVGLKIPREILEQKNKDTIRTWIDYQKTNYESYDKPGLIYALGLQGLLYCFLPTDIYLYLKPLYEPRSIGIMLGLAASKIGSRDENIMKAVGVHLSCTYQEYTDLQLAMTVECAGLVSIGLIYKGTCNKQFSQVMLREIIAKPNKEKNHERER